MLKIQLRGPLRIAGIVGEIDAEFTREDGDRDTPSYTELTGTVTFGIQDIYQVNGEYIDEQISNLIDNLKP